MMGFGSTFLSIGMSFLDDQREIKRKNEDKLSLLKKEYWETVKLPRKKKKMARKRIEREYQFWYSLGKWHDEIFHIGF